MSELRGRIILCPGQGCEERESCARYCVRGEFPWASYDLERALPKHQDRPCPQFFQVRTRQNGK